MSSTPALPAKRAIRPAIRRGLVVYKCAFRRPKNANFFLPKEQHTYINPRYDTSNPSWRPVAPRSRPVVAEAESSLAGYESDPASAIYCGCTDEILETIMEPTGSMMNRLEEISELRMALHLPKAEIAPIASC